MKAQIKIHIKTTEIKPKKKKLKNIIKYSFSLSPKIRKKDLRFHADFFQELKKTIEEVKP